MQKSNEFEAINKPHLELQEAVWKTRIAAGGETTDDKIIIGLQTITNEKGKEGCIFDNTPTINFEKDGKIFIQIDGVLNEIEDIIELITRYHNDYEKLQTAKQRISGDITGVIGNFDYSAFTIDKDIEIEIFKYREPRSLKDRDPIYRVTHKKISIIVFGNFNNVAGIENLLDASLKNEKQHILPILKADIIKWPHFAHLFRGDEKTDKIIMKLNEVIKPYYIVWKKHHTQSTEKFIDFITRFTFHEKFII